MDIKKQRGIFISGLLAIIILVLSIMPADLNHNASPFFFTGIDKVIHGVMYLVFTLVVLNEYFRQYRFYWLPLILMSTGILAYSVCMEILQYLFISSRSGEVLDVVANLTGILLGIIALLTIRKIRS